MSYAHNQKYNPHKSKNSSKISHKMTPVCQATWKHYVLAFVLLMVIDTLWIQLYFLKPYTAMIEEIQNQIMEVRPACFVAAYTAMLVGLFGVVIPNIDYSDMSTLSKTSFLYGSLTGFAMYGTYAFTAASLLIKFQISIAIQDTLWGTFLYGITPFLTFYLIGLCDKKKDNDEARVRLD